MTPNEILRDFRTKYLHTFVWVKLPESGKEVLCYIDVVSENRDRQAVIQLSSNEYGTVVLNYASNHELRFKFPTVGSFQMGADSMVIRRRAPHRQYQRGLGAANHEVLNCASNFVGDVLPEPRMSLDTLAAAFKQEKYRGKDAFALLMKGRHRSVALDGMFSLCQPMDASPLPMVFMGTTFIGRVQDDLKFVPYKGAESYQNEVQQILTEI